MPRPSGRELLLIDLQPLLQLLKSAPGAPFKALEASPRRLLVHLGLHLGRGRAAAQRLRKALLQLHGADLAAQVRDAAARHLRPVVQPPGDLQNAASEAFRVHETGRNGPKVAQKGPKRGQNKHFEASKGPPSWRIPTPSRGASLGPTAPAGPKDYSPIREHLLRPF